MCCSISFAKHMGQRSNSRDFGTFFFFLNARPCPPQTMHRGPFGIFRVGLHSRAGAHPPRRLHTVAGLLTATDFSKLLIASSWNLVV